MYIKICNICNVCICNVYVCNVYIIYMSRKKKLFCFYKSVEITWTVYCLLTCNF